MKCDKKMMTLYAVTDRAWVGRQSLYEQIEAAINGGATCIQLREKELGENEFLKEAIEISALCKSRGVPLIINDNVDIAVKCGADGVHVGQDDMSVAQVRRIVGSEMIIGASAHSVEEALEAVKNGADYLGAGAVFATSTKSDTNILPLETLRDICRAADVPVVAIGGINKENIMKLSGSGADGVALVSAVFSADDIEQECRLLRKLSEQMVNS
ncbi:MAG: thiamine phosphate synthase [Acutalibacteraceae bacterium]